MKLYIRFGDIPKNEKSDIWVDGISQGKEIGVSVYDTVEMTDGWHAIMPLPISPSQGSTYDYLVRSGRPVYLVTGKEIGLGKDNEPLLTQVRIIKNITSDFVK